jgi:hypothetical protein
MIIVPSPSPLSPKSEPKKDVQKENDETENLLRKISANHVNPKNPRQKPQKAAEAKTKKPQLKELF